MHTAGFILIFSVTEDYHPCIHLTLHYLLYKGMSKVYSFGNEPETLAVADLAGSIIDPAGRCILLVHDQQHFGRELHAWPGIYRSFAASITLPTLNLCSIRLIHDFNGPVIRHCSNTYQESQITERIFRHG